ncbi:MAG: ABC transporter permease [Lachnospiraceae bacterium]|nr:ABC transporter permease [Lachnospiraceae bacterium]
MIIINEFRAFFRDRISVIFLIAFPLILIYLLGNILNSLETADSTVGTLKAEYVMETDDPAILAVAEQFIAAINEEGDSFYFTKMETEAQSRERISNEEIAGLVRFQNDGVHILQGNDALQNRTLAAVMNGFMQSEKAIAGIQNTDPAKIMNLTSAEHKEYIKDVEFNKNRSMLDYYGVCMLLMIICFSSVQAFGAFGDERNNKTINRLIAAPLNRTNLYLQKLIGMMPSAVVQIAVIMSASVLLFHVRYATGVFNNVLLFMLFFMTMLVMLSGAVSISLFVKGNPAIVFMPLMWLMLFFSGAFAQPIVKIGLAPYMPITYVKNAAFSLTIFGEREGAFQVIAIEAVIIVIFTIMGVIRFNRMQETR